MALPDKVRRALARTGLRDTTTAPRTWPWLDETQPSTTMLAARKRACLVLDRGGRTALELSRDDAGVVYVPMATDGPFRVARLPVAAFDATYTERSKTPVPRAAKLYAGYAQESGGTSEVMAALAGLVHLSAEECDMARKKLTKAAEAAETKAVKAVKAAQAERQKYTPKAKRAATNGATAAEAPATAAKTKQPTSAARFRALIMAGGQTDDQIFAVVQKEFTLDPKKRSYVAWYRNDLRKKGQNPPDAQKAA